VLAYDIAQGSATLRFNHTMVRAPHAIVVSTLSTNAQAAKHGAYCKRAGRIGPTFGRGPRSLKASDVSSSLMIFLARIESETSVTKCLIMLRHDHIYFIQK
jgi:hypothetical protein